MAKLISWNVNGLRACMNKGFEASVAQLSPDILCLQETKLSADTPHPELSGYQGYYLDAQKKGYSGTALFTRITPQSVAYGIGIPEHDREGRVITARFTDFTLVNVYTPNAQRDLARIDYRVQWEEAFRGYVAGLDRESPVVICGDPNVAHQEIDLKNPGPNKNNAGFSPREQMCIRDSPKARSRCTDTEPTRRQSPHKSHSAAHRHKWGLTPSPGKPAYTPWSTPRAGGRWGSTPSRSWSRT